MLKANVMEKPKKRAGKSGETKPGYTLTHERSLAMNKRRAQLAAQGKIKVGRPKGVLNAVTMAKINSRDTFVAAVQAQAGMIANELLKNVKQGDTRAALGLLDRAGIPASTEIKHTGEFSLAALGSERVIEHRDHVELPVVKDIPTLEEEN